LFRVTYVGKESTEKAEYKNAESELHTLRKKLEGFHSPAANPEEAVGFIIPCLKHPDRFIRYAARVALEHQPVKFWQDKILEEKDKVALINGAIALAHQGDKSLQPKLIAALGGALEGRTSIPVIIDLIRAYSLCFTRMGEPDKESAKKVLALFDPMFPGPSDELNRELVQLLVYLKSPTIVEKVCVELKKPSKPLTQAGLEELLLRNRGYGGTIANMLKNAPDQQKLAYLFSLRNATVGWNMDRWKIYYGFLKEAQTKNGGSSYRGFLTNIEKDAFANATDTDRLAIEAAGLRPAYKPPVLPKPIGPGKEWTTADLVALEGKLKNGRDFKNGQRAFAAARCVVCHRFAGDGGATGPDLSQVAGRFGLKDMAEALVEPSKVISDQYKASVIRTTDDKTITGKIVSDTGDKYIIVIDPENSTKVIELPKGDVAEVKPSNISLMPEKLLNTLNENEVLDMLAYMFSRGDPNHPMFKK
jgi:putative heme-binding domain-containing protein